MYTFEHSIEHIVQCAMIIMKIVVFVFAILTFGEIAITSAPILWSMSPILIELVNKTARIYIYCSVATLSNEPSDSIVVFCIAKLEHLHSKFKAEKM